MPTCVTNVALARRMLSEEPMTDGASSSTSHGDRVRSFYDAWNRRDWAAVASRLDADVEWFNATRREQVRGVDAVVALLKSSADAFPSARIEVRELHVNGDFAFVEWSVELEGSIGPNAKRVSELQVFTGDKCVRGTSYGDVITLLLDDDSAGVAPEIEHIIVDLPACFRFRCRARSLRFVSLGLKRGTPRCR